MLFIPLTSNLVSCLLPVNIVYILIDIYGALNKLGHFTCKSPGIQLTLAQENNEGVCCPTWEVLECTLASGTAGLKASAQEWTSLSPHPTSIFHSSSSVFRHTWLMWSGGSDGYWQLRALLISVAIPVERDHLSPTGLQSLNWLSLAWPGIGSCGWNPLLIGQARLRGRARFEISLYKPQFINWDQFMHWTRESVFLSKREWEGCCHKEEEWVLCIASKNPYYTPSTVNV